MQTDTQGHELEHALVQLAHHLGTARPSTRSIRAIKAVLTKHVWPHRYISDTALCTTLGTTASSYHAYTRKVGLMLAGRGIAASLLEPQSHQSAVKQSTDGHAVATCPITEEMSTATIAVRTSATQGAVRAVQAALSAVQMRAPSGIHRAILKLAPHLGSPRPNEATLRAIKASLVRTLWPHEFPSDAALCMAYNVSPQHYSAFHCQITQLAIELTTAPGNVNSRQTMPASPHQQLFIDPID